MGTGHGVQIDRMREFAIGGIFQVQLDGIADAHPHERPGHRAVEGPKYIFYPIGKRRTLFNGLEFDDYLCRRAPGDGRWDIGWWSQFRCDHRRWDG
jgi:hypothetical protein